MMIAATSSFSFVLGATVAYLANRYPEHREAIETAAGVLLIGGLGLLGYGLKAVLGHT